MNRIRFQGYFLSREEIPTPLIPGAKLRLMWECDNLGMGVGQNAHSNKTPLICPNPKGSPDAIHYDLPLGLGQRSKNPVHFVLHPEVRAIFAGVILRFYSVCHADPPQWRRIWYAELSRSRGWGMSPGASWLTTTKPFKLPSIPCFSLPNHFLLLPSKKVQR